MGPDQTAPAASQARWPRTTDLRAVTDAVLCIATSGCQWRMPPKDFPPVSTVRGYFHDWRDRGLWQTINHLLVMSTRELEGREASPTAGVIDSQWVKTTESGGVCGCDAGKNVKGRKRHMIADTLGLMLFAVIHAADIQDRDGAPQVLKAIRHRFPWLRHVFADGGHAGPKLRAALRRQGDWTVEVVKRSDTAKGFEVLPRRVRHCRSDQWRDNGSPWSAPSHGSGAAADWQRIGKHPSKPQPHGPSSPASRS